MVTEASRVRDVGPILLTGAPGIAGRHLFAALAAREAAVVAVSRRRGEGWTVLDVADPASLSDMPDVAGIIHCAGATPRSARLTWRDFYRDNVLSTVFLARRAARRQSLFFIYVSTMGSLRQQRTRVGRLYVISKRLAERCLRTILDRRVALWILRAGTLYGEHDQGSVARLIRVVDRKSVV